MLYLLKTINPYHFHVGVINRVTIPISQEAYKNTEQVVPDAGNSNIL